MDSASAASTTAPAASHSHFQRDRNLSSLSAEDQLALEKAVKSALCEYTEDYVVGGVGWGWMQTEARCHLHREITDEHILDEIKRASAQRQSMFANVAASLENPSNVDVDAVLEFLELCNKWGDVSDEMRNFLDEHEKGIEWVTILLEIPRRQMTSDLEKIVLHLLKKFLAKAAQDLNWRSKASEVCKYLEHITAIFDEDKPLYMNHEGKIDFRSRLTTHFLKDKFGFQHFASYTAAHASTPRFPPFDTIHLFVDVVAEEVLPNTGESTQRVEKLRKDVQLLWESLRTHMESRNHSKNAQSKEIVTKICEAIVKIDPSLRASCFTVNMPTRPVARVSVSPSQPPPAEFRPAIDSAERSLKSSQRLKASTVESFKRAEDIFTQAHVSFCLAHNSLFDARRELSLAETQVRQARALCPSINGQVFSIAMVNNARSLLVQAEVIKSSCSQSLVNAERAYSNAMDARNKAYTRMEGARADRDIATKEVDEATSYFKHIDDKFGVVVLDADSPVRKRQRSN